MNQEPKRKFFAVEFRLLNREEQRTHYLKRLRRYIDLKKRHSVNFNHSGVKLVDSAIFDAYTNLTELGLQIDAQNILDNAIPEFLAKQINKTPDQNPVPSSEEAISDLGTVVIYESQENTTPDG